MNNPIPANPDQVVAMAQDGADLGSVPTHTQGQQVGADSPAAQAAAPEPSQVASEFNDDSHTPDFWDAMLDESTKPEFEPSAGAAPQQPTPEVIQTQPVVEPQPGVQPTPTQPIQPQQQAGVQPGMAPQQPAVAPAPDLNQMQQQLNGIGQQVSQVAQAVQPQVDPNQLAAQQLQQATDYLATNQYALSEQDAEMMISEPEKVLPQMAARMHVQIAQEMGNAVRQNISHLVQPLVQQELAAAKAERTFFDKYPGLDNPEFKDTVKQSLALAIQLNPNANREQLMALAASGAAQTLQQQGRGTINLAPQQQAVQQPQVPQQGFGQPYSPAAAAVQPSAPVQQNNAGNIWAQYATDDDFFN